MSFNDNENLKRENESVNAEKNNNYDNSHTVNAEGAVDAKLNQTDLAKPNKKEGTFGANSAFAKMRAALAASKAAKKMGREAEQEPSAKPISVASATIKTEQAEASVHEPVPVVQEPVAVQEPAAVNESAAVQEPSAPIPPPEPIVYPPPEIKLKVSSDNLVAYVRVKLSHDSQIVDPKEVEDILTAQGIVFGVDHDAIKAFCEKKAFFSELVAARGIRPIDGLNGTVDYYFKTDDRFNMAEKEDGTVNYRELGLIQNVEANALLASATLPIPGTDGVTIFAARIPHIKGKQLEIKSGENTVTSEDKTEVRAAISGCVELKNGAVVVNDIYTVKGDVDISVGNLNCQGSIVVHGDVREGFTLKAQKDIIIKGMIEGAQIIAGGNVTISNGMNGMGKGKITAQGDVVSKYFENAFVESGSCVYSDVIINSKIKAKDSVILKGGKSSIIGGSCKVGKMVYAGFIGSHTNAATNITIDSPELRELLSPAHDNTEQILQTQEELHDLVERQDELQDLIQKLSATMNNPAAKTEMRKAMQSKNAIAGEISQKEAELVHLRESTNDVYEYKVVASKTCFIGVKITIGYVYLNVSEDYNATKFCIDSHTIIPMQTTPADKA